MRGGEAATTVWVEADPILADEAASIVASTKPPQTTWGQADPAENGCLLVVYIKALRISGCIDLICFSTAQPLLTKLSLSTRGGREAASYVGSSAPTARREGMDEAPQRGRRSRSRPVGGIAAY